MNAFASAGFALPQRPINCPTHGHQDEFFAGGIWRGCNACNQAIVDAQNKSRKAQVLAERAVILDRRIGLPAAFADQSIATFLPTNKKQSAVVTRLIDYVANDMKDPTTAKNIILMGATGGGKTHLATAVLREQAAAYRLARYITSAQVVASIRDTWGKKDASESSVFHELAHEDLLLIDEIGQRDDGANAQEILSQLIDMRYKRAPTIITSNLTLDQLRAQLGDRAFDRLNENLITIHCDWGSYRQAQASKNREEF
jgi:DNA replication protein DnaC